MPWKTNQELIAEGDRERKERTLGERIEDKADDRTTDVKLFEELFAKTYELQELVAKYNAEVHSLLDQERDIIRKIKVAFEGYKKAIKK